MPRKSSEPPPIQTPKLTVQQIDNGISRLRRRIDEIEKLRTDQVRHDDGHKESVEAKVRNAIGEIFGENSPQFRANEYFEIQKGVVYAGASDAEFQKWFLDGIPVALATLKGLISELEEMKEFAMPSSFPATKSSPPSRKIFVVHGHDEAAKEATARFLTTLEFEPIILHEKASGGLTIIEKFEKYSNVAFAVVLLTPDDVGSGKAASGDLRDRARQNVVFELGFFIGKLGRAHVCALHKGDVELPSDFNAVVYVKMDSGNGWRMDLAKELSAAGLTFDWSKLAAT